MFSKYIKYFDALPGLALLCGITPMNAQATFIDFDDIVAPPAKPFSCERDEPPCGLILSNEYEPKGLIFWSSTSWLIGGTLPDGTNRNSVLGTNGIGMTFVGTLPNFVSFNVHSAANMEASYFHIYGENDELLFVQHGSGWNGSEETSTPYIPGELVSINSSQPIKGMYISSHFDLRTGPTIDNLTFEYRSVPEPSPLLLGALGLCGILWRRRIARIDK